MFVGFRFECWSVKESGDTLIDLPGSRGATDAQLRKMAAALAWRFNGNGTNGGSHGGADLVGAPLLLDAVRCYTHTLWLAACRFQGVSSVVVLLHCF